MNKNLVFTCAIVAAVGAWSLVLVTGLIFLKNEPCVGIAQLGQLGDMFGLFNALATGLALCCAIYAAVLQNNQMQEAKAQFEKQLLFQEKQIQDSKTQFEHQLSLQNAEILQAKQLHMDERKDKLRDLRREKLEHTLCLLHNLRAKVGAALKQVGKVVGERAIEADESRSEAVATIMPAFAEIEVMVGLYFQEHSEKLLPYKSKTAFLEMALKDLPNEADRKSKLRTVYKEFGSACVECISFGTQSIHELINE